MKIKNSLELMQGELGSPCSFLIATRKWNPIRIDAVPIKISEHEYKRNVDEMGAILYKHIESQVQRQSKEAPSSETESNGSTDPETGEVA